MRQIEPAQLAFSVYCNIVILIYLLSIDAAVKGISRVGLSSADSCSIMRSCIGLSHSAELIKKRAVLICEHLVEQFPTDAIQLCFDELLVFLDIYLISFCVSLPVCLSVCLSVCNVWRTTVCAMLVYVVCNRQGSPVNNNDSFYVEYVLQLEQNSPNYFWFINESSCHQWCINGNISSPK